MSDDTTLQGTDVGSQKASTQAGKASTCRHCAVELSPDKRSHARFCSASCRTMAWRRRRRAAS
jgi:hypothetical protein